MKLSEENKKALLLQMHQIIYESIKFTLKKFETPENDSLEYFVLTNEEEVYMSKIKASPILHSVIEKILTRNLDNAFLNFLGVLDGTSEPLDIFGKKSDFLLIDMPDDFDEYYDFLHDEFFETYDLWKKTINS